MQQGANSLLFLTSVHLDGCNRAALLSDIAFLGKIAVLGKLAFLSKSPSLANSPLGKVITGVITSIPLALMQSLRCPHRRRCPGGLAAHPFTGVNARLLVLGLFGVFPARLVPIRACARSSSDSSK
jgi:hypothetical protein